MSQPTPLQSLAYLVEAYNELSAHKDPIDRRAWNQHLQPHFQNVDQALCAMAQQPATDPPPETDPAPATDDDIPKK